MTGSSSNAKIEATSLSVSRGETGEAFAVCPANKRALGGGVVQSGQAEGLVVRASGPLDDTGVTAETRSGDVATQWYAAAGNQSGQPRDFKVFAICSADSNAKIEATSLSVPSGKTGEAFAVCPANKRVLGGGVVQSGPPDRDVFVVASGPLDATGVTAQTGSDDVATQWYAAVFNGSGQPRDFKVFAICQ